MKSKPNQGKQTSLVWFKTKQLWFGLVCGHLWLPVVKGSFGASTGVCGSSKSTLVLRPNRRHRVSRYSHLLNTSPPPSNTDECFFHAYKKTLCKNKGVCCVAGECRRNQCGPRAVVGCEIPYANHSTVIAWLITAENPWSPYGSQQGVHWGFRVGGFMSPITTCNIVKFVFQRQSQYTAPLSVHSRADIQFISLTIYKSCSHLTNATPLCIRQLFAINGCSLLTINGDGPPPPSQTPVYNFLRQWCHINHYKSTHARFVSKWVRRFVNQHHYTSISFCINMLNDEFLTQLLRRRHAQSCLRHTRRETTRRCESKMLGKVPDCDTAFGGQPLCILLRSNQHAKAYK